MVEIQNIPFWEKDALQDDELGPVAYFGAMFFIVVGFLFTTDFISSSSPIGALFPAATSYALLAGAIGVIMITPGVVLSKLPVSLAVLILLSWMLLSVFWTDSVTGSAIVLARYVPIYIGFTLMAGVLPKESFIKGLLIAIRIIIIGTFFAVLIFPETRLHSGDGFVDGTYPGWHGFFIHKNSMSPILVFSLITVLSFERSQFWRFSSIVSIAVLLVFSTSGTGLSGAIVATALFYWLKMFSDLDARSGAFFFVSSVGLGILGGLGAFASLNQLTAAYGKDLTFSGRTDIWSVATQFVAEKPIGGWGFGGLLWNDGITPRTNATSRFHRLVEFEMPHPHSGVLDVLLQLGFVGLGIFGILYIGVLAKSWRLVKKNNDIGIWIFTVLIAQLFMSLSESLFLGAWLTIMIIMKSILMKEKVYPHRTVQDFSDKVLL